MLSIRCLHKSRSSSRNGRQVASDSHNAQRRISEHFQPPNLKFKTAQASSEESCFPSKVVLESNECLPFACEFRWADGPPPTPVPRLNPCWTLTPPSGHQKPKPLHQQGLVCLIEAVCRCYLLKVLGTGRAGEGWGEQKMFAQRRKPLPLEGHRIVSVLSVSSELERRHLSPSFCRQRAWERVSSLPRDT